MTRALKGKDQAWLNRRKLGIGGSDAVTIMGGDAGRIHQLWEEKTGRANGFDLSHNVAVQIGNVTEGLNADLSEIATGFKITQEQAEIVSAVKPYMRCTLDGIIDGCIFEAKYHGGDKSWDALAAQYTAQLHHNAYCHNPDADRAYLAVLFGKGKHQVQWVDLDCFYMADLLEAEARFWHFVETDTPPTGFDKQAIAKAELPTIDLTGNNLFADQAAVWLASKAGAKQFEAATKELKAFLPEDAGKAFGYGIEISRDGRGISVKEIK